MTMLLSRLAILCILWISGVVVQAQQTPGCLFTMEQLLFNEDRVTDYSVLREYVICENREFNIGILDYDNNLVEGSGSAMLPLRPNLHLRCGGDGSRDNNCFFIGGDVQVDGTNFFGVSEDMTLENIVLEGFTFVGAGKYSIWATKRGDITFVDCEWRDITESYAPLYFDFYDASTRVPQLRVDFVMCSFNNNRYYGDGSVPAVVTANGEQNPMFFDRCRFENNDFVFNNTMSDKNSFLIESSGQLRMSLNCFYNNTVGVATAVAYATTVESDSNFGDGTAGDKCRFLARYDTRAQFDSFSPSCDDFESANICFSDVTGMPSASPTNKPTTSPSYLPTNMPTSPSAQPSLDPSGMPSLSPTIPPPSESPSTSFPSISPSQTPSGTPTTSAPSDNQPSASPSMSPSASPTSTPTLTVSPTESASGSSMRLSYVTVSALVIGALALL